METKYCWNYNTVGRIQDLGVGNSRPQRLSSKYILDMAAAVQRHPKRAPQGKTPQEEYVLRLGILVSSACGEAEPRFIQM